MGKLLLGAAAVVASLSLATGVAAAQTGDISVDTSPGAHVRVDSHNRVGVRVTNKNKLRAYNDTYQKSSSGDTKVKGNGEGGSATSGNASNTNGTEANAEVTNNSALDNMLCGCEGSGTGDVSVSLSPESKVKVDSHDSTHVSLYNNNDLQVDNVTTQKAYTGDATVQGNGSGGDATSGDASNENTTTVSFVVSNN